MFSRLNFGGVNWIESAFHSVTLQVVLVQAELARLIDSYTEFHFSVTINVGHVWCVPDVIKLINIVSILLISGSAYNGYKYAGKFCLSVFMLTHQKRVLANPSHQY